MAFSVNTNLNAIAALQTLSFTERALSTTQSRINTGFKINGTADNASTFAIAQGIRADIAGLQAVQDSLALGQSTVAVASSAATQIQTQLQSLSQKVVQGQNANVDLNAIQDGINSITSQIDSIAAAAQFNGVNLINSSTGSLSVISSLNRVSSTTVNSAFITVANQDLTSSGLGLSSVSVLAQNSETLSLGTAPAFADGDTLKLTLANNNTVTFEFNSNASPTLNSNSDATDSVVAVNFLSTDSVGTQVANLAAALRKNGFTANVADNGDLTFSSSVAFAQTGSNNNVVLTAAGGTATVANATTTAGAAAALAAVNAAINTAKTAVTNLGTATNALQGQDDFVSSLANSLTTGVSGLVDADLAAESANLQAEQTKQSLGIQALSIANQSSSAVLSLFR
jgi:flagellin